MFQDLPSLSKTQNFAFSFTIFTSTPLYTILTTLHASHFKYTQTKNNHLPSTFQRHQHNSNIVVPFDPNMYV